MSEAGPPRPRRQRLAVGTSAREALRKLAVTFGWDRRKLPRLVRKSFVTLTVETPAVDDEIVEDRGVGVLAISKEVVEQIGDRGHIELEESPDGEVEFKIIVDEPSEPEILRGR